MISMGYKNSKNPIFPKKRSKNHQFFGLQRKFQKKVDLPSGFIKIRRPPYKITQIWGVGAFTRHILLTQPIVLGYSPLVFGTDGLDE